MSKLNIGSPIPNWVLFTNNIAFSVNTFIIIVLPIIETTNANDLFKSFGTCLFSASKNGFNSFFIPLLVKYIIINNITKLIPKATDLYVRFFQKTEV